MPNQWQRVEYIWLRRPESWQFIVYLGGARQREKTDWPAMLPAEDVTGWLSLDFGTKFMKVNPLHVRIDGEPNARFF
ncbi:MAG TPA: hypothetical protein VGB55_08155 [Tepidisphaeraceae bacterium]|jgi:hypothetical protein